MKKGYLLLLLHAHLPFVKHPEHAYHLEENWFFEALNDTYIPFVKLFDALIEEGVDFRITMTISPTLSAMLKDGFLRDRFLKYLSRLQDLATREVDRNRFNPEFHHLALMYWKKIQDSRAVYLDQFGGNLLRAFRKFQDAGKLEILTCGATHGYLPLMNRNISAHRAQVRVAVEEYKRDFGRPPRGIWLPECGYEPGLDAVLKEEGIRHFFVDTHGILFSTPRPKFGVYAPLFCPSGVAAFGRDMESSKQVWSAREGYPGDYWYREYYRDVGFDLDLNYIHPYIHPDGVRINTGLKYYRITGPTPYKEPYSPEKALERAALHAGNFMFNREKQVEYLSTLMDRKPIIVAPYDAELFGHWWYEGPEWLNFLIRKIFFDQKTIRLITASEYLSEYPVNQVATPSLSSWGYKGYNEVWLNGANDWIYRHLHKAAERMVDLVYRFPSPPSVLVHRALNQAVRELLLAQSSDWAFIMKTGTLVDYAVNRTRDHIVNFTRLYQNLMWGSVEESFLKEMEEKNSPFPELDYRVFSARHGSIPVPASAAAF